MNLKCTGLTDKCMHNGQDVPETKAHDTRSRNRRHKSVQFFGRRFLVGLYVMQIWDRIRRVPDLMKILHVINTTV